MLKSPPITHLFICGHVLERYDNNSSYSNMNSLISLLGGRYVHKSNISELSFKRNVLIINSNELTVGKYTTSVKMYEDLT